METRNNRRNSLHTTFRAFFFFLSLKNELYTNHIRIFLSNKITLCSNCNILSSVLIEKVVCMHNLMTFCQKVNIRHKRGVLVHLPGSVASLRPYNHWKQIVVKITVIQHLSSNPIFGNSQSLGLLFNFHQKSLSHRHRWNFFFWLRIWW